MPIPTPDQRAAQSFYVTCAIDYPNGAPHIGHSLEKVAADVVVRYRRLLGDDVAFCLGLDENSQHVVRAAERHGVSPTEWVDRMDAVFRRTWDALNISRTSWVRTTEPRHVRASQELFRRAQANGDIYRATYSGWYCPNDNTFYTEDELVEGRCPNHPTITPEWLEEENYFFALTKYQDRLLHYIEEHPDFIVPTLRQAEVLALIRQGLRDFSVSRPVRPGGVPWGVPVPGDPSHVLYVWFDALTTYLTAVGFEANPEEFASYWPADAHVIGKDITRFHCIYWPAMLMSAGLPLPKHVVVHGFMTLNGQRISTTTGNVIDPVEVAEEYGADAVRYYLMRDVSFASDGDFSLANLIQRYNNDLANDLGNLLNRVVAMISRYRGGEIPKPGEPGPLESDLRQTGEAARDGAMADTDRWQLNDALATLWTFVRRANQYLEERKPWLLAKDPAQAEALDTTLYSAAEAVRLLAIYLWPYMPAACDRILTQLGLPPVESGDWVRVGQWGAAALKHVVPAPPIFPKIEAANVS